MINDTACGGDAWQVRVCGAGGSAAGAGVLLGRNLVLTCAHIVSGAAGTDEVARIAEAEVRVESAQCWPRWSAPARVIPGCWAAKHGTQRGDVTLLRLLDKEVRCHSGTRLRKAPMRDTEVSVHGFPDRIGRTAEGKLVGAGYDGEWVEMHPLSGRGSPWVTRGFSGAGVTGLGTGHVIGILIALEDKSAVQGGTAPAGTRAWMMPTAVIASYLPPVRPFIDGIDAVDETFDDRSTDPGLPPLTDVDRALLREVRSLFDVGSTWSGTAVITGAAGAPWLARLVAATDPAVRQRMPDAVSPPDTALGIGTIDLALDAEGRTLSQIRGRIADRLGLPGDDAGPLVDKLVRHRPPPTMVIDRVDSARDQRQLLSELLGPLAERARRQGIRLLLSFARQPPAGLPHELSLGPEPVTGTASRQVSAEDVRERLAGLAKDEGELLDLYAEVSRQVAGAARPHPCMAPRLRVRAAVADAAEMAVIYDRAGDARASVARMIDDLNGLKREHEYLRLLLGSYWARAEQRFGAEDAQLGQLHSATVRTLQTGPCDLDAARRAVDAYAAAIEERTRRDEGGTHP